MTAYTIKVRELGKRQPYQYIGTDGAVRNTALMCKPLSKQDAELAKRLLTAGAAKAGRPIDCRVVVLKTQ